MPPQFLRVPQGHPQTAHRYLLAHCPTTADYKPLDRLAPAVGRCRQALLLCRPGNGLRRIHLNGFHGGGRRLRDHSTLPFPVLPHPEGDRVATIDTPPIVDSHEAVALTKFDELIPQYQSFAPLTGHDPSASS